MNSRHSDIFGKKTSFAQKSMGPNMYLSESQRSFTTRNSLSPANKNDDDDHYGNRFEARKRSKDLSEIQKQAMGPRMAAEDRVKRFGLAGTNKAWNRGFYEKYTTESVLVAARDESKRSIDREMAELMSKEKEDLFKPDLVMVPSGRSVTGWHYVKRESIERR